MVEFASYSEMRRAIDKLDNTELNGRNIRLTEDKSSSKRRKSVASALFWVSEAICNVKPVVQLDV